MSPAPQLIGRMIAGRFRVTGFIGEGAMAAVYRGIWDGEPRDVAIKIMHPQLLGDSTFVGRFKREATAAARLNHKNTVQIIDHGVEGRLPYIVMELVVGKDLFDLLVEQRRLSQARAVRILMEICDVLSVAHEHGIVHRDLKPENVMIVCDPKDPSVEHVKVLDFGIAKIVEVSTPASDDGSPSSMSTAALTTVGMVVGTPAYMSPEQCRGDPVDGRSDLYSCGIMLYLLVTGRLPFQPTGMAWEVAMEHIRNPPPAPSMFLPDIHPGLEATILTTLSKFPAQRHQSAKELRDELEKLLPLLPTRSTPGTGPAPVSADTMPVESIRSRPTISVRAAVESEEDRPTLPADPTVAPDAVSGAAGAAPRPDPPSLHADSEGRALPIVNVDNLRGGKQGSEPEGDPLRIPASDEEPDSAQVSSIEVWVVSPDAAKGVPPKPYVPPARQENTTQDEAQKPDEVGAPAKEAAPGSGGTPTSSAPWTPSAASVLRGNAAPRGAMTSSPRLTAPTRRRWRPPRRSSAPRVAQIVVGTAVLVGLLIGVIAFLLSR